MIVHETATHQMTVEFKLLQSGMIVHETATHQMTVEFKLLQSSLRLQ